MLPAQGNWTDPHNPYTFLGKEWDEHLGLYEFGVRLYDPWAGVWLTREPLPGRAWEPRTWHRYAYAFASPISYYDLHGLQGGGPNRLDRLSASLGMQLDRFSQNLGHTLDAATRLPTGAQCTPFVTGYSPWKANLQALWILASWFFEIGPEVQWYGPESPFTQILRYHPGVQRAREEWKAAGYPQAFSRGWRIEEAGPTPWAAYLQENIKMVLSFAGFGSPTPEGPINPLGGVVGSYKVKIMDLGDGRAFVMVVNETDWGSGTRRPGTDLSLLPPLERSETDWSTTLVTVGELPLVPIMPIIPPKILQQMSEGNRAILPMLSQLTPGEWGGMGGKMVQYYYWVEEKR